MRPRPCPFTVHSTSLMDARTSPSRLRQVNFVRQLTRSTNTAEQTRVCTCVECIGGLRSAVGCKPREAVLYPDTVAGANPKVGPYCSSRWLLEGLWLMQRSEFRRATHIKGSSSRAAADGGPPRPRHLSVRPVTVARVSTARAYQDRPEGIPSQTSRMSHV